MTLAPKPHRVTSQDGSPIVIHDLGGSGQPLLFVHGVGLHGLVFLPMTRLLARSFRCYSIDLRGHGASGIPPTGDFRWSRLSEDVLAVVDFLDLPELLCVAHSAGATAALRAEALRPGIFRAMYCYEPIMSDPAKRVNLTSDHPLIVRALRRKSTFPSFEAAVDRYQSRPPLDSLDPDALWAYVRHGFVEADDGGIEIACRPESEAATYLGGNESDLYHKTSQVLCPVFVAYGGSPSNQLGRERALEFVKRLPNASPVEFPTLGHFGPLEDPAAVASSILDSFSAP